jgi:hypothetical protein
MTFDEKMGQLFMVAAYRIKMMPIMMLSKLITENKIGGLIFFKGGPYVRLI